MFVTKHGASVLLSLLLLALISGAGRAAEPVTEKHSGTNKNIKESRDKNGAPSKDGKNEWEKRRDEFNKLPPAEREAKRLEIKTRLEKRITELRVRQTNSTLSTEDTKRLERSEQLLKRFEQNGPGLGGDNLPAKPQREEASPRPPEK